MYPNVFVPFCFISKAASTTKATSTTVTKVSISLATTSRDGFGGSGHFEDNRAKYIHAIAAAFGHPSDLVHISLKPNSLEEFEITFQSKTAAHQTNMANVLNDIAALKVKIDNELSSRSLGVKVGGSGITGGSPRDIPGNSTNKFARYLRHIYSLIIFLSMSILIILIE